MCSTLKKNYLFPFKKEVKNKFGSCLLLKIDCVSFLYLLLSVEKRVCYPLEERWMVGELWNKIKMETAKQLFRIFVYLLCRPKFVLTYILCNWFCLKSCCLKCVKTTGWLRYISMFNPLVFFLPAVNLFQSFDNCLTVEGL